MQSLGFDTGLSETPIIPVMCENQQMQRRYLLFSRRRRNGWRDHIPMVGRDKARVRTQMSAGLTRDDLNEVLVLSRMWGKSRFNLRWLDG